MPPQETFPAGVTGDDPGRERRARIIGLALALAVAALVRLAPLPTMSSGGEILLGEDGDTYYHALRAEEIARSWPRVPWVDGGMNFPYGAEIPWPPLFDHLVATTARALGAETPRDLARVAAVLPVLLGLGVVAAVAALATLLTGGPGWPAALLVAVLPASARLAYVGRADHHVLEALLSALAVLLFARGCASAPSRGRALALGVVLAAAFWNWPGSALYLVVLAACVAALHVALPDEVDAPLRAAGDLAAASLTAAVLLAGSIAVAGPPRALLYLRLAPISGLSVLLASVTAAGAAILVTVRRRRAGAGAAGRALQLVPAALPALVLLAVARQGVAHGFAAFGAANPWYRSISEFWPLLFSGWSPWTVELAGAAWAYGLTPLTLPGAAFLARRAWRAAPEQRPRLVVLATWTVVMFGLALVRRRFEAYAALPLAVCAGWCVAAAGAWAAARLGRPRLAPALAAALALLVAAPAVPSAVTGDVGHLPEGAGDKFPLLSWISSARVRPGREAVLSFWGNGHEVRWLARRPTISTPFGTDIDPRSLGGEAAFLVTSDPSAARAVLDERRVGYLLLQNPVNEVATIGRFAPGAPSLVIEEHTIRDGVRWALHQDFFDLVVSRLYFLDGAARGSGPALADYRLVGESPTANDVLGVRVHRYKLFEVVSGAVLRIGGLPPGSAYRCSARVISNVGRTFEWAADGMADPAGDGECRVPYATGANGLSRAEPCVVATARGRVAVSVPDDAVIAGRSILVGASR